MILASAPPNMQADLPADAANAVPAQVEQATARSSPVPQSPDSIAPPESIQAIPISSAEASTRNQMQAPISERPLSPPVSSMAPASTQPAMDLSPVPNVDRELVFEATRAPSPPPPLASITPAESAPALAPVALPDALPAALPQTTSEQPTDAVAARRQVIEQRLAEIVRQQRQQQATLQRNPIAPAMQSIEAGPLDQAQERVQTSQLVPVQTDLLTRINTLDSKAVSSPETPTVNLNTITALPYGVEVLAMLRTIVEHESSNNHQAVNPHSGALGYGQIMPELLRPWSLEAVGRAVSKTEFLNDPSIQLQIIAHRLNQYWQKSLADSNGDEAIAVRKVASLWYSGKANLFDSATPQYYKGHRYPSIADYTINVLRRYQQEKQNLTALVRAPLVKECSYQEHLRVFAVGCLQDLPCTVSLSALWAQSSLRALAGTSSHELTVCSLTVQPAAFCDSVKLSSND